MDVLTNSKRNLQGVVEMRILWDLYRDNEDNKWDINGYNAIPGTVL